MEAMKERPQGYLEVLNKTGRVSHRIKLESLPFTIGRAFDNDLILDDPYACPHHASLSEEEGRLILQDMGSINGISDEMNQPLTGSVELKNGGAVHIGRTPVRFNALDAPLAPTLIDRSRNTPLQILHQLPVLIGIFLLTVGTVLFGEYMDSAREFEVMKQAPTLVGLTVSVVLWSMLWSFASRLVVHRWHFWTFCGIGCLGLLTTALSDWAILHFGFAFAMDKFLPWLDYLQQFLIIAAVLYLNLRLTSSAAIQNLVRISGIIALVFVVLAWGVQLSTKQNFSDSPGYRATLKSPAWKLSGSKTAESFFDQASSLAEALRDDLKD